MRKRKVETRADVSMCAPLSSRPENETQDGHDRQGDIQCQREREWGIDSFYRFADDRGAEEGHHGGSRREVEQ